MVSVHVPANVSAMRVKPTIIFFCCCLISGFVAGLAWHILHQDNSDAAMTLSGEKLPDTNVSTISSNSDAELTAARLHATRSARTDQLQAVSDTSDALFTQERSDRDHPREASPDTWPYPSFHDGIMRAAPSVASVYARALDESGNQDFSSTVQGSGVVVDADGVVLTNLHIVNGLDDITVVLSDGRLFAGLLIGSDAETDLAVIRIPATGLSYLELNEAPPLKVGDIVLAIGNPLGVGQTVTQGIVSATRRRVANTGPLQSFVQIDAAINPGNSGGALINPYGQLVGVNTAVPGDRAGAQAEGIGFSIPAHLLAHVVPQIIEFGSVSRGSLGINVENLRLYPRLASRFRRGAVISDVHEDGPADLADLRRGDVIVALNDVSVNDANQLLVAISTLPPNESIRLTVMRREDRNTFRESGKPIEFTEEIVMVKLGEQASLMNSSGEKQ